jgi:hypothetical protein
VVGLYNRRRGVSSGYLSAPVERESSMIRAQYVLIAEYQREGQGGKLDLLGVFDRIYAPAVPAQHRSPLRD